MSLGRDPRGLPDLHRPRMRRAVGWVIPAMVMLLMGYIFFGEAFPGIWKLKGIGLRFVVDSCTTLPWASTGV